MLIYIFPTIPYNDPKDKCPKGADGLIRLLHIFLEEPPQM